MRPSTSSASSAPDLNRNHASSFAAAPLRTVSIDAAGSSQGRHRTVRANQLPTHTGTAADGADAPRAADSAVASEAVLAAVAHRDRLLEFEERAAIAEYDGGLTRAEAERLSADLVNRGA